MPIEVTREEGMMSFRVSGSLLPSEPRETLSELYSEPDADFPRRQLWDLREATLDWSTPEVKHFVDWVKLNRPPVEGRTALVVSRDFHFGLARMYEILSVDIPVELVVSAAAVRYYPLKQ